MFSKPENHCGSTTIYVAKSFGPLVVGMPTPPPPLFWEPAFPESARNVGLNQWISDSGGKKDHLLKVFVLW